VLLLVVWIVVLAVAVVILGGLLYSLLGAVQRLRREVEAMQAQLRPVLEQAQDAAAAAAARQSASS
jgi:predicted Holliday junction resolvase-like endonuclease